MKKVIFVTHGGSNIGMGHVIRCMSLASAFKEKGYQVRFISKYKTGQKVLLENNYEVIPIAGNETQEAGFCYGTEEELKEDMLSIVKVMDKECPDILVVDSYNVTEEFLKAIAKNVKCSIYIDDLAAFCYPVDIIINGNISASLLDYQTGYKTQKLLLGLEYNLIRQEFMKVSKRDNFHKRNSIMISTGAADPFHMTEKILCILMKYEWLKQYTFHVVIGNAFQESVKNKIKEIAAQNKQVIIYENPSRMSEIMMKADLAITAGGSTLYELFACGVITFAFIYADNQRSIVEMADKMGYLFNIGDYTNINELDLISKIEFMFQNTTMRREMITTIQKVIDCKGTMRIVKEVEEFIKKEN